MEKFIRRFCLHERFFIHLHMRDTFEIPGEMFTEGVYAARSILFYVIVQMQLYHAEAFLKCYGSDGFSAHDLRVLFKDPGVSKRAASYEDAITAGRFKRGFDEF